MGLPHSFCLAIFSSAKTLPPANGAHSPLQPDVCCYAMTIYLSYLFNNRWKEKQSLSPEQGLPLPVLRKAMMNICSGLPGGRCLPFSLANQHQGWEGGKEGEASQPSDPTLFSSCIPLFVTEL